MFMQEAVTRPDPSATTDPEATGGPGLPNPGGPNPGRPNPEGPSSERQSRQSSNPDNVVTTRRVSFEESLQDVPKYFTQGGDLITSHLMAALSSVFPDGEDFFVRSVRHYRDRITDPELKKQVAGFIGQESVHGREHRAFNDRLAQLGYGTKRAERFTRWGLELRTKHTPPISCLAATAALEHFTATLAEAILTDEEMRAHLGHPAVQDLFVWHALEESEHKAVAFDVYRAVGGSERMRILVMRFTRYGFVTGMSLQVAASVLSDRNAYRKGRLRDSFKNLLKTNLLTREMWEELKAYEDPGFHPDDRDTKALVAEWRERLFGAEGELNDKLPTASAA